MKFLTVFLISTHFISDFLTKSSAQAVDSNKIPTGYNTLHGLTFKDKGEKFVIDEHGVYKIAEPDSGISHVWKMPHLSVKEIERKANEMERLGSPNGGQLLRAIHNLPLSNYYLPFFEKPFNPKKA